jgi:hypothetical protein
LPAYGRHGGQPAGARRRRPCGTTERRELGFWEGFW